VVPEIDRGNGKESMEKEISSQNVRNNSIMNSILQKDKRKKE
jgi:hypothetical protein